MQAIVRAIQLVDTACRVTRPLDSRDIKIVVPRGGAGHEGARREGRHNLREVERHPVGVIVVSTRDPRHVAFPGPADGSSDSQFASWPVNRLAPCTFEFTG